MKNKSLIITALFIVIGMSSCVAPKKYKELEMTFDYHSEDALNNLKNYNVEISEKLLNN